MFFAEYSFSCYIYELLGILVRGLQLEVFNFLLKLPWWLSNASSVFFYIRMIIDFLPLFPWPASEDSHLYICQNDKISERSEKQIAMGVLQGKVSCTEARCLCTVGTFLHEGPHPWVLLVYIQLQAFQCELSFFP